MNRIVAGCVVGWVLATPLRAADAVPVLTEVQALTLDNQILALRLADAQLALTVQRLQRPGYTFDLATRTYTKDVPHD